MYSNSFNNFMNNISNSSFPCTESLFWYWVVDLGDMKGLEL